MDSFSEFISTFVLKPIDADGMETDEPVSQEFQEPYYLRGEICAVHHRSIVSQYRLRSTATSVQLYRYWVLPRTVAVAAVLREMVRNERGQNVNIDMQHILGFNSEGSGNGKIL